MVPRREIVRLIAIVIAKLTMMVVVLWSVDALGCQNKGPLRPGTMPYDIRKTD